MFEDFCQGVLNFPNLIPHLDPCSIVKEPETPINSLPLILEKLAKSLEIPYKDNENIEHMIDIIVNGMKYIKKRSKSKIVEICNGLFQWIDYLRDQNDGLIYDLKRKNSENSLDQEMILSEKQRAEENYVELMNEHRKIEDSYKMLQKLHMETEQEFREINMQLEDMREKYEAMCKNLAESMEECAEKNKIISDLHKKIRVKSSMSLPKIEKQKTLTPKSSSFQFNTDYSQILFSSLTPKPKESFNFDKSPEPNSVKDQIIRKLKNELIDSAEKFHNLEKEIKKMENQNNELIEKIKFMSFKNLKISDDEEDYKYETIESLKDEIAVIDTDFRGSRYSFKTYKTRDISIQTKTPTHKKQRYSCFSFF